MCIRWPPTNAANASGIAVAKRRIAGDGTLDERHECAHISDAPIVQACATGGIARDCRIRQRQCALAGIDATRRIGACTAGRISGNRAVGDYYYSSEVRDASAIRYSNRADNIIRDGAVEQIQRPTVEDAAALRNGNGVVIRGIPRHDALSERQAAEIADAAPASRAAATEARAIGIATRKSQPADIHRSPAGDIKHATG